MKKNIFLLGISAILLLGLSACGQGNIWGNDDSMSPDEARDKVEEFINQNLLQEGQGKARVSDVSKEGDLYKLTVQVGDQSIESYVTKDGKKFFPEMIDMENPGEKFGGEQSSQGTQPQNSGQQAPQQEMSLSERAEAMVSEGRILLEQYGDSVSEEDKNNFETKLDELEKLNQGADPESEELNNKIQEVLESSQPIADKAMEEQQNQQQQQSQGQVEVVPQP